MNRLMVVLLAVAVTIPALCKSRPGTHVVTPAAFSVFSAGVTTVRVEGDVMHPGIYALTANIMTDGVIALAEPSWKLRADPLRRGGDRPPATGTVIHLSRNTDDSAVIRRGSIPAAERMVLGIPLDIGRMGAADWERLPGIGPVLAERIETRRQNNGGNMRVEDLISVEGIGEKKYNVLKKYF